MKKFIAMGIVGSIIIICHNLFAKDYIITIPDELVPAIQSIVADKIVEGKKTNPDYYISEIDYLSGILTSAAQSWARDIKEKQMIKYKEMLEGLKPEDQAILIQQLMQKVGVDG